jgi:hypothetical protein
MSKTAMALMASAGILLSAPAWAHGKAHLVGSNTLSYAGEIVSVDVPARELVVKSTAKKEPSEMTFHVTSESSVFVDGQLRPLAALEKGERVKVSYEMKDGDPLVTRIHRHKKHGTA